MKKIVTLFAAVLCGLALNAKTLYLNPGVWETTDAKFAVYGSAGGWGWLTGFLPKDGSLYKAEVPDNTDVVIFVRLNPNGKGTPDWDDKWNQTGDLSLEDLGGKIQFNITCWDCASGGNSDGNWSEYDGQGGGPVDPQPGGAKDYYIRGFFNGTDTSVPTAEELFENGILADFAFTGDDGNGYFYVMVCDEGALVGRDYMLSEYAEGGTHVTLYDKESTGKAQKWGIPVGTVTFYLYDNGDGTLELSIEQLPGKTLVGGGQGIENTPVNAKAHKTIIDGQLRIIRGDKMFDATGRQL